MELMNINNNNLLQEEIKNFAIEKRERKGFKKIIKYEEYKQETYNCFLFCL